MKPSKTTNAQLNVSLSQSHPVGVTERARARANYVCVDNCASVVEADNDVGPAPCDGCMHNAKCGGRLLACEAFAQYINTNRWSPGPREPTREIYARVFAEDDAPKPAAPKPRSEYVARRLADLAGAP